MNVTATNRKKDENPSDDRLWNVCYITLFFVNLLVSMTLYMTNTLMAGFLAGKNIAVVSVGNILGIMSIASMCIRPFSGFVCDYFSRKRLLLCFLGLYMIVMLGYGFSSSISVFYVLRVLQGISFSIVTTVTMAYISEFIPESRIGEGLGYFGIGQSLAAAVGPGIGLTLSRVGSGIFPFYGAALFLLLAAALVLTVLPDKSGEIPLQKQKFSLSQLIAKEALLYALMTVALSAVNGIETSYIASYAGELKLAGIGWYFTVSASVLFISRILFGRVTDSHGFSWALYPGSFLIILALIFLGNAGKLLLSVTFCFAMAAILKAFGVGILQPAIQANCLKSVETGRRGAASSTYYIGTDLGQGVSTVAAGRLITRCGYSGMYLCYIVPMLVIGLIYLLHFMYTKLFSRKEI